MVDCIIALLVPAAFNKVVCNDVDYSCYDQTKSFLCHRSCVTKLTWSEINLIPKKATSKKKQIR